MAPHGGDGRRCNTRLAKGILTLIGADVPTLSELSDVKKERLYLMLNGQVPAPIEERMEFLVALLPLLEDALFPYSAVVWGAPIPRAGAWEKRLAPLIDRPGKWVDLGEWHSSTKSRLSSRNTRIPPGRWEFKWGREFSDGLSASKRHNLYGRYVGPEKRGGTKAE